MIDLWISCSFCSVDKILHIRGWEKAPLCMEKESKTFRGGKIEGLGVLCLLSPLSAFSVDGNENKVY